MTTAIPKYPFARTFSCPAALAPPSPPPSPLRLRRRCADAAAHPPGVKAGLAPSGVRCSIIAARVRVRHPSLCRHPSRSLPDPSPRVVGDTVQVRAQTALPTRQIRVRPTAAGRPVRVARHPSRRGAYPSRTPGPALAASVGLCRPTLEPACFSPSPPSRAAGARSLRAGSTSESISKSGSSESRRRNQLASSGFAPPPPRGLQPRRPARHERRGPAPAPLVCGGADGAAAEPPDAPGPGLARHVVDSDSEPGTKCLAGVGCGDAEGTRRDGPRDVTSSCGP